MHLSGRDLNDIRTLGGLATDCQTKDDLRDELLRRIQSTLNAPSGLFFHFDNGRFHTGFSRGVPEEAPEAWRSSYWKMDPFITHFLRHLKAGGEQVCVSSRIVAHLDYVRSDFYCDFLAPQAVYHVLVAGVMREKKLVGVLGLHRPQNAPAFSATDVLKINLILPHFSAAVEKVDLHENIAARQIIIDTLAQDLACSAVLMLDEKLQVVIANHHALSLLGLTPGQIAGDTALPVEMREGCRRMGRRMESGPASVCDAEVGLSLRLNGLAMHGFIRAQRRGSDAPRFIVCFGTGDRNLLLPGRLDNFGLSRRETEIAHLVSLGLTNSQIGDRLNISIRTVENHLRSVFGKVKVHNRTSLISHLAREH